MSTENKFVKKAREGEAEAFGKLYDKHLPSIYRFIFLRVRHKSDAEDITQQVFLSAWQNIRRYRPRQNIPFSSWLYKIAKNAVIDHVRTKREHVSLKVIEETVFSESIDLSGDADKNIKLQIVKRSLNKLTEAEQNVLIMKFVNELSNKEIAETLNKNEGGIRVIQHRALKKLKGLLSDL